MDVFFATGVKQFRFQVCAALLREEGVKPTQGVGLGVEYLLVNGLEKFPLVLPDFGVVHLPHQFGVLVNEPRLPENVRSCVFHLQHHQSGDVESI